MLSATLLFPGYQSSLTSNSVQTPRSSTPIEVSIVPSPIPQTHVEAAGDKVTPLPTPTPSPTPQPVYTAPSGLKTCLQLLQETGVVDITNALNVLSREDRSCDPYAKNPTSTACGIGQDINGCEVGYDQIAQIQWFENYVIRRYGSYASAWGHELQYGWY